MMKSYEPWHTAAAMAVVGAVAIIVSRWSRRVLLGLYGVVVIILPAMTWYLEGRISAWSAANIVIGVLILSADLTGRLPDRDTLRRKLFRQKPSKRPD